jgi:hypothetical protein
VSDLLSGALLSWVPIKLRQSYGRILGNGRICALRKVAENHFHGLTSLRGTWEHTGKKLNLIKI